MTILIDMDDTLEMLLSGWTAYLNKKYNLTVDPNDINDWDVSLFFPSLSHEQVYEVLNDDAMWDNVYPMEGSVEYVKKLIDENNDVFLVTSTGYKNVRPKMEKVILRYYPFIPWKNVIITSIKQMIRGDILIDDAPFNLIGGSYHKILFHANHNASFDENSIGAIRVTSWKEAYEAVNHFKAHQAES